MIKFHILHEISLNYKKKYKLMKFNQNYIFEFDFFLIFLKNFINFHKHLIKKSLKSHQNAIKMPSRCHQNVIKILPNLH